MTKPTTCWMLDDYAQHYVAVLHRPSNAWGQHLSEFFGQSHNVLQRMRELFGDTAAQAAVSQQLNQWRNAA